MTITATATQELTVEAGGLRVRVLRGGAGAPLVLLHDDNGGTAWGDFENALAASFTVHAVDLPGWGGSERPEWARDARDLALLVGLAVDRLGLDRAVLVGLGFGGWVAAEMATMNHRRLSALALVGALGILPRQGEIFDQYMISLADYARLTIHNQARFDAVYPAANRERDELIWEFSREMTARISWKPYMYNRRMLPLLQDVATPALVAWGRHDRIAPLDCGEQYAATLPNARLVVVEDAGHRVDIDQPERLAALIRERAGA